MKRIGWTFILALPLLASDALANGTITSVIATPGTVMAGGSVTVTLHGSGVCPFRSGGITVAVDYGDGSNFDRFGGPVTLPVTFSHTYKSPGKFTVTVSPNMCAFQGPMTTVVTVTPNNTGQVAPHAAPPPQPTSHANQLAPPPAPTEGETIVSKEKPWSVAADSSNVYYTTTDGRVVAHPLNGSAPLTIASNQTMPSGIAAYNDGAGAPNLYWANRGSCTGADGSIMSSPSAMAQPTAIATGQNCPKGVVAANARVYWTIGADNSVRSADSHGGGAVTMVATQTRDPFGLAVDSNAIYWVAGGSAVMTVGIHGGPSSQVAGLKAGGTPLASDGDAVYGVDGTSISRAPRDNSGAKIVVSNLASPVGPIAVDGTTLYYVTNGEIWKKPAGGGPARIVGGQGTVTNLAFNGTHVFWAVNGAGTIKRAPK
jgi:hypothetical protein